MTQAKPPIPLIDLDAQYRALQPRIEARLQKVLTEGRFILGPEVAELEESLARFTGARHAISVANGTDALKIALMAEGIGPGDAVFVPAYSFVATAEMVVDIGAAPVFVDIEDGTFNIDPDRLRERVEVVAAEGRLRPRAVIPVDLFGRPADYAAIAGIAEDHGLFLLADAAQSFGGAVGNQRVGTLAPVTTTSFYPSKSLGCYGDGGCVFTDDGGRAEAVRCLARHGFGADGHSAERVGLNSRLDTLQAAILLAKLEVFEDELASRGRVAGWYEAELRDVVATPAITPGIASAWSVYTILVERRDQVRAALQREGIATAIYYTAPIHLHPAYAGYGAGPGSCPVSERASARALALPMHPYLDEDSLRRVCQAVRATVA